MELNNIYRCDEEEKLKEYRQKLYNAIQEKKNYPEEGELPDIYIVENKEIDLSGNFGEPYYSEIDINLINSTNTSSCGKVYSNYERVIRSIPYIQRNECRPISVIKDGNCYYVKNGKHRFLAYTLLEQKNIPVSIQEKVSDETAYQYCAVEYKRNLYSDDGNIISYPEQMLEFYNNNQELFIDIKRIEMKCIEKNKKYQLVLVKGNGDIIEFKNGISAGNGYRSSKVVKEIISGCGFDIDMNFIKENLEFTLEEKDDAHNIHFCLISLLENDDMISIQGNIEGIDYYMSLPDERQQKINKLHSILVKYKEFNTVGTYFTAYNSGIMELQNGVYYFIGSDCVDNDKNYIYLFRQDSFSESNLDVKFLCRISREEELYNKISKVI